MTTSGLGNPLRQAAVPYDDGTKDYLRGDGGILENYHGTGTQAPAFGSGAASPAGACRLATSAS